MRMEHDLFHSRFKSSVGRSSLLDIIRDSPLGENPHREAAMELVFDRTIDDCQERILTRAKKSSQADLEVQPSSHEKPASTLTAVTQPAIAQTQPLRTEPGSPKTQMPQPSKVQPPKLQAQPHPKPPAQPLTSWIASSYPPPTLSTNVSGDLKSNKVTPGASGGPPPAPPAPWTSRKPSGCPSLPVPSPPKPLQKTSQWEKSWA